MGVIKVIVVFVVLLVFFLMRIIGVDCLVVQQPCMFHCLFVFESNPTVGVVC